MSGAGSRIRRLSLRVAVFSGLGSQSSPAHLERVPRAIKEYELEDGSVELRCIYTPHSIRATTATLLLDADEDIREVQKLLGHRHVTVTQIYDKRRRGTKDSASHRLSI